MNKGRRRILRYALAALFIVAAMGATGALTASNTVPSATAGSGSGTISGYTASSVSYTINSSTPTSIDAVSFTLNAAATTAKIKLVAAGSTWYSCTNSSGNNWSCDTTSPQASLSAADQLTVAAVQ
jgi:hypothetical protein